jgi:hypothetical protein
VSIRTLYYRSASERSVALVEVTEDGADPETGWEFHCQRCDQLDTMLSEADAHDLFARHRCEVKR